VRPGRAADHSPLSSAAVMEEKPITLPTLWATPGLERENFTFIYTEVTLRHFRVTSVSVEKQLVFHILFVCSLSNSARKVHAPH